MSNPRVSIIIPAFNNGPFIAEALNSVFRQQCGSREIIVVDDGSTDDTRKVVKQYLDKVIYHLQPNQGAAAARNYGLIRAKGDYIAFLDGDDVWFGGNLELKLGFLARNPDVGAVFSNFRIFDSLGVIHEDGMRALYPIFKKGRLLESIFSSRSRLSGNGLNCLVYKGRIFESLLFGNFIATCSMLIRRECACSVGLFREDLKTQEDYDYWLRLARNYAVACLDLPLVGYRRHSGQLTNGSDIEQIMLDVARTLEPYRRNIRVLPEPAARRFRKRYTGVMNSLGVACLRNGKRKDAAWAFRTGFFLDFGNLRSLALWLSSPLLGKNALSQVMVASRKLKTLRRPARAMRGAHAAGLSVEPAWAGKHVERQEKTSVQGS